MEKLKILWLSLALGILFIPLSFSLRKFSIIEAAQKPKVEYDPKICTQCKDCPCTYTLKNKQKYTVNKNDKNLCKVGLEAVFANFEDENGMHVVYMDGFDYNHFASCIEWYSRHPSGY